MYYRRYLILPLGCLCLAGCGVRQYRRLPLPPVSEKRAHVVHQQDGIKVCARKLTREDLKSVFDGRTLARNTKITGFAITVENRRATPIFLDPKPLSIQLVLIKDLAEFLGPHAYLDSSLPLVVTVGLACCTFFTAAIAIAVACEYGVFAYLPIPAIFGSGTLGTGIASYYRVKKLAQYCKDLELDLQEKVLNKSLIIPAYGQTTTLLFVRNAPKEFTLMLHDRQGHKTFLFNLSFFENNNH